jgi:hypothetical protein
MIHAGTVRKFLSCLNKENDRKRFHFREQYRRHPEKVNFNFPRKLSRFSNVIKINGSLTLKQTNKLNGIVMQIRNHDRNIRIFPQNDSSVCSGSSAIKKFKINKNLI